jgi:hypothetical protein
VCVALCALRVVRGFRLLLCSRRRRGCWRGLAGVKSGTGCSGGAGGHGGRLVLNAGYLYAAGPQLDYILLSGGVGGQSTCGTANNGVAGELTRGNTAPVLDLTYSNSR